MSGPDWPPRSSASQYAEGTQKAGSTGQLWEVRDRQWKRVPGRTYFIDFDTKEIPGKLVATKVTIDRVVLPADDQKMNIALVNDPLFPNLQRYVRSNSK